jgi:hypothetical protein
LGQGFGRISTFWAALAAAVGVAILAVLALRLSGSSVQAGSAAVLDGQSAACAVQYVDFAADAAPNFEPDDNVMVGAVVKARSIYNWPCPTEPARSIFGGRMVVVPLLDRDSIPSFLVTTSATEALVLSETQWASLLDAYNWAETIGVTPPIPKRLDRVASGAAIVMADDWTLVGAEPNDRHIYLPTAVHSHWRSLGGMDSVLGQPMSNGYVVEGELRFDFAGGYLSVRLEKVSDPEAGVKQVASKIVGLPAPLSEPDLIVIQDGSTWLRSRGERFWVPTPQMRSCLAGQYGEPVAGAGVALARLTYGGLADCATEGT